MDEKRNELDIILRGITAGLTGESEHDIAYLQEQMEKYKTHEMAKEIIRACGRLVYNVMPEDAREKFEQLMSNEHLGVDATLDEIRFNMYKGDFTKARIISENLVRKIEEFDGYTDDIASEYHTFDELFEELLYEFRNKPDRDLRQADIRYSEIYLLYGTILVELKEFDGAKKALETAMRWNPMSSRILFEYAEIFKMTGDMERFFGLTKGAFKIAFHAADVARCYRNLGYYFVEKELYKEATACYLRSMVFDPESKQVQSELFYISTKTGEKISYPSQADMEWYSDVYGFPLGADQDIVGLSYAHGKHCYDQKDYDWTGYFWNITYDLTNDEEIKEKLEEIQQEMN